MKKHQRYFPVEKDGQLLPYFIAITNVGDKTRAQDVELIVEGNEHVIRARFEDAAFFVGEDIKIPFAEHLAKLDTLTFQAELGSMFEKSTRMRELVADLAPQLNMDSSKVQHARRAAELGGRLSYAKRIW
jgi:glycyl-tRNA synthetase beta subunit